MVINTDLTHLPEGKQNTIAEIRRVILNEFEGEAGRHEWIAWIILFSSHARGNYVDNPINGYISDYWYSSSGKWSRINR